MMTSNPNSTFTMLLVMGQMVQQQSNVSSRKKTRVVVVKDTMLISSKAGNSLYFTLYT